MRTVGAERIHLAVQQRARKARDGGRLADVGLPFPDSGTSPLPMRSNTLFKNITDEEIVGMAVIGTMTTGAGT